MKPAVAPPAATAPPGEKLVVPDCYSQTPQEYGYALTAVAPQPQQVVATAAPEVTPPSPPAEGASPAVAPAESRYSPVDSNDGDADGAVSADAIVVDTGVEDAAAATRVEEV
jgi:hypothetical protein